jgi:hypothetical protein
MKFIIITYKDNIPFAEETKKILHDQWDINAEIILGYKVGQNGLNKNQVVMAGFRDNITNYDDDIYYLEDDIRFTSNPLDIPTGDIVWSVYRFGKLTNKIAKRIVGAQAIYFSQKALHLLKEHITKTKLQHIDGYFSKFILTHPQLSFIQLPKSIGYEQYHESLITQQKDWIKYTKNPS